MLRRITLICCLLVGLVSVDMAAQQHAITITSTINLSQTDISAHASLLLAGITSTASADALQLVWGPDNNAWGFPLWSLELQGSAHIIPAELTGLQVAQPDSHSKSVRLLTLNPVANNQYSAGLSYCATTGRLSILLVDTVRQVTLYQTVLLLNPLSTSTQLTPLAPNHHTISQNQIGATYVPLGLRWHLAHQDDFGQWISTAIISAPNAPALSIEGLHAPYPLGEFRLVAEGDNTKSLLWAGSPKEAAAHPAIHTDALAPGPVTTQLEYVVANQTWPIGSAQQMNQYAGTLTLALTTAEHQGDTVAGSIVVASDTHLAQIPISLIAQAAYYSNGQWLMYDQPLLWHTKVGFDAAGQHELPFTMEAPDLEGRTIKLQFSWQLPEQAGWLVVAPESTYDFSQIKTAWQSPIPTLDIAQERWRQVLIERVPGQYLGHPDTVLMADGQTIFVVYPLGHGGPTVLRRSDDAGMTWSERLPVPQNWAHSINVPTIFRLTDPAGVERLIVFNNVAGKDADLHQSLSTDGGTTWTPFASSGLYTQVAPNTVVPLSGQRYLTVYQLNGRIVQSITTDGGVTWQTPRQIASYPTAQLTEPAVVRSPDGKQLAVLIRENTRQYNSMLIVSDDAGQTWSTPVELPDALTGDRHMPRYAEDGRLVITFRDRCVGSATYADFVAWVGTYEDLVNLRDGAYRVRLLENTRQEWDTGYAGLELLPDGALLAVTYVPYYFAERPSVVSVRFSLPELDAMLAPK